MHALSSGPDTVFEAPDVSDPERNVHRQKKHDRRADQSPIGATDASHRLMVLRPKGGFMKPPVILVAIGSAFFLHAATIFGQKDPAHVGGVAVQIQTKSERPWLIDLDTRLQRRANTAPRIGIDGSKQPELLLPWELHQFLLSTAFYRDDRVAEAWRRRFQLATPELRITDDFWQQLRQASSDYLRDQRAFAMSSEFRSSASIEAEQCHRRMIALERANKTFGEERFMKFLYLSVARDLKVSSANAITPERHRFISRGCQ